MLRKESLLINLSNKIMTGKEDYEIMPHDKTSLDGDLVKQIIEKFRGLPLCSSCEEKSVIVKKMIQHVLPEFNPTYGGLHVWSIDFRSAYGFNWNPPFEGHAWLQDHRGQIIDFSLPGIILRGLETCDEIGPYLINRDPVILAGFPPSWCKYTAI